MKYNKGLSSALTVSYFYITVFMSVILAFPSYRPQLTSFQQKKDFCDSLAMKTVMADLALPVPQSNFRRIQEETSEENEMPPYDSPVDLDVIQELKEMSETNVQSSWLGDETSRYARKVLSEFYKVRDTCLIRLVNAGYNKNSKALANDQLKERMNLMRVSGVQGQMPGSRGDRMLKRERLSLNPSGWRKRRDVETDEDDETFLRNMRQLLEKRRRRLQFNPTGW